MGQETMTDDLEVGSGQTDDNEEGQEEEVFDPEAYLESLSDADPRFKEHYKALQQKKKEGNLDAKKARLRGQELLKKHKELEANYSEAQARLKEIDDKEKPAIQKASEEVQTLRNELAKAKQEKSQYETNLFLLQNDVPPKSLDFVSYALAKALKDDPSLDKDDALATIREEHSYLFGVVAPPEAPTQKVVRAVSTGASPKKPDKSEPKPGPAKIARKSNSPQERRAYLAELAAKGIRLN